MAYFRSSGSTNHEDKNSVAQPLEVTRSMSQDRGVTANPVCDDKKAGKRYEADITLFTRKTFIWISGSNRKLYLLNTLIDYHQSFETQPRLVSAAISWTWVVLVLVQSRLHFVQILVQWNWVHSWMGIHSKVMHLCSVSQSTPVRE